MNRDLIFRYFQCQTSGEEEKGLRQWLDADPRNVAEFDSLRFLFNAMNLHGEPVPVSAKNRGLRKFSWKRIRTVAALAGFVILSSALLHSFIFMDRGIPAEYLSKCTEIEVPAGQRTNLTLADGTNVWLNSSSRLGFPNIFSGDRRVKLSGEGYFDVSRDENKPFIIETFACDIEVLGTSFNVLADEESGRFCASLVSGSIRIYDKINEGNPVVLSPNMQAELIRGGLIISEVKDPDEFLWTEGLLSLGNISFRDLVYKLERAFGVSIVLHEVDIPDISYGGKIRISDGWEHTLELLRITSGVDYYKDRDTNEIHLSKTTAPK
ncbi:MAG: FecR domain-containing protein [Rikenellaceae bacterium]|nr:FecR domain-containing protein [Rikenellaceae bacterium]